MLVVQAPRAPDGGGLGPFGRCCCCMSASRHCQDCAMTKLVSPAGQLSDLTDEELAVPCCDNSRIFGSSKLEVQKRFHALAAVSKACAFLLHEI